MSSTSLQRTYIFLNIILDLWELPPTRHAGTLADILEKNYYARCPPDKRPYFMRYDETSRMSDNGSEKGDPAKASEDSPLATDPVYDESLFAALYQSFKPRILGSGLLILVSGPWLSVQSCRALHLY